MANFSLTPTPSASHESTAFVGICAGLLGEITCKLLLIMCTKAAVRFLESLVRSCCEWRLFGIVCKQPRFLRYLAVLPVKQPLQQALVLLRCTFHTRRGCMQRSQPFVLLQSLTFSPCEEVTLSCSSFHQIFLSALLSSDLPLYHSLPLFRTFTPCAQRCLFSATALLTFSGSEVSLVKLTNLVIRSCCLGTEQ